VGPTAATQVSASSDGKIVFRSGGSGLTTLQWLDRFGKASPALVPVGIYHEPALSPDGKRVAMSRQDQDNNQDIWILDITRNVFSRFTLGPGISGTPNWTPDGAQLIYASNNSGGHFKVYRRSVSGVGNEELVFQSENSDAFPDDISPDGKLLIFELQAGAKTKFDLWLQPITGDGKAYPIIQSEFSDTHARFSPDGRYIAYSSDQTGRSEIYVRNFPSLDGVWQISTAGGDQVLWSRTGKELFYMSLDRKLISVPFTGGASFQAGQPSELFSTQVPLTGLTDERNHYLASPDGQRFLVNNLIEESSATPLTVIVNWQSMLKK
jgi:dipeptidyl aminopeptidase/acylaminoacyl peptidase